MERLGQRWKQVPAAVRKPVILLVGSLIVIGGLLLIPLPGPGWVIVFAGLALLATEFAAAEKLRAWAVRYVKHFAAKIRRTHRKTKPKKPKA